MFGFFESYIYIGKSVHGKEEKTPKIIAEI